MEQRNAYSDGSVPAGSRTSNRTLDGFKQIGAVLYVVLWVIAFSIENTATKAVMMIGLSAVLLVTIHFWMLSRNRR